MIGHVQAVIMGLGLVVGVGLAIYSYVATNNQQNQYSYGGQSGQTRDYVLGPQRPQPSSQTRRRRRRYDPENNCSLCLSSLDLDTTKTISCGHEFHEDCLNVYQHHYNICPKCKVEIPEDCLFCYESLGEGVITETSCKHSFHKQCLDKWFDIVDRERTCPTCRKLL